MMKFLSAMWLGLLLASSLPCPAQSSTSLTNLPEAERKLIAIKVAGSKRYSEDAIAAASGLQIGTIVTEDDFKRAARRLGDAGVFTEIAYSYSYSSAGLKAALTVTDAQKFVPARFEDFVWFSDAELRRRIKDELPLFDGEVPVAGRLADQVSDVLQAMLVENAIPGDVEFQRTGKADGPVDAIVYQVTDVLIQIRKVEFTGAGAAELPALEAAGQRLTNTEYSRSRLNQFAQRQLLPVYQERGYLKASFAEPETKVVKMPSANPQPDDSGEPHNLTMVDVSFAVTPGAQYKLKSIEWAGNKQFPSDQLQKMVHLRDGDPANIIRLADNLKDVQKLYGSRGYVTAAIKADAEYDDPAGTVVLHLNVKEGYEYHMGDLELRGLDNSLMAKLRNAWKIRAGEIYDASYLDDFLPMAQKLLPAKLDWEVSSHVTANLRDKTVDVDLIYSVKAPK